MVTQVNLTCQAWLGGWDDFRTAKWVEIVEYPEITLQQTQQLLTITA